MNKEFLKKIIKAEILKYEAIKELFPERTKEKIEDFQKEFLIEIRDLAVEMITEISDEEYEKPKKEKIRKVNIS